MPPHDLIRLRVDSDTSFSETETCSTPIHPVHDHRLGIIFDLDGTLIAERCDDDDDDLSQDEQHENEEETFIRPGVLDFLRWTRARGHALAVWTAAHPSWAHYVTWKLCTAVDPHHDCRGAECRRLFSFVWTADRLRTRQRIPVRAHGQEDGCCWCHQFGRVCDRCTCRQAGIFACPCRRTKDLKKVWKAYRNTNKNETHLGNRRRSLIVENTPQQCVHNYGNAVYVPSYRGRAGSDNVFSRMKHLVVRMEQASDVRAVSRCNCCEAPHACVQQCWWQVPEPRSLFCRPVAPPKSVDSAAAEVSAT